MASGRLVRIVVLNDGETFTDIEGTEVVDVFIPAYCKEDETSYIERCLKENRHPHGLKNIRYSRSVNAPWLCIVGNPFDGLTVMGPFSTSEEATQHGEGYNGIQWSIIQMTDPTT